MAINFPASPSVNDTFTAGSITYKWDGAKWIGLGVTPADRLIEGSNSLEITAGNDLKWIGDQLIVGDFAPVDDRNGGGIHIRHSNGISFKSNSGQSVSRNWRIRGDDWGWGNLDFGVGDSVSDWSDAAADNVLSLTSGRNVGIGQPNPQGNLHLGTETGANQNIVMHTANNGGARLRFREGGSLTSGFNEYSIGMQGNANRMTFEMQGQGEVAYVNENGIAFPSGKGIDFSADGNASGMTSELLNDYEHGTWTPTITNLGDHSNTAASTWGKYTKIGNRVWITWRYSWSSRSTTNGSTPVYLDSLPFTSANDAKGSSVYIGGLEGVVVSNNGRTHYGGYVLPNNTRIIFRASGENVSENSLQGSNATSLNNGYIYGGASYIV